MRNTVDSCYQIYGFIKIRQMKKFYLKLWIIRFFLSYKNFLSLLLFQTICHMDIDKYSYIDFEKISFYITFIDYLQDRV